MRGVVMGLVERRLRGGNVRECQHLETEGYGAQEKSKEKGRKRERKGKAKGRKKRRKRERRRKGEGVGGYLGEYRAHIDFRDSLSSCEFSVERMVEEKVRRTRRMFRVWRRGGC